MDHPDDYAFAAQRDFWDYSIDSISLRRPLLPRRSRGRKPRAASPADIASSSSDAAAAGESLDAAPAPAGSLSLTPSLTHCRLHLHSASSAAAAHSLIIVPTGEVDIAKLSEKSSPGDLVYAFGRCMGKVTATFKNIHNYVTWLRSQSIRLDTPELMDQVKNVFAEAHIGEGATLEGRDRYARYLRSLLSCETLPEHFSVTTGVSVPCYNIGDAVDGQIIVEGKNNWFAGVVVDTRSAHAALSYEVFWIGSMPKKQGGSKNPSWVSVHSLRSHVEGSLTGLEHEWADIEKIRTEYDPDRRKAREMPVTEVASGSAGEGMQARTGQDTPLSLREKKTATAE